MSPRVKKKASAEDSPPTTRSKARAGSAEASDPSSGTGGASTSASAASASASSTAANAPTHATGPEAETPGAGQMENSTPSRTVSPVVRIVRSRSQKEIDNIRIAMAYGKVVVGTKGFTNYFGAALMYIALHMSLFAILESRLREDPYWQTDCRTDNPVNILVAIGWRLVQFTMAWLNECDALEAAVLLCCSEVPITLLLSQIFGSNITSSMIQLAVVFIAAYLPTLVFHKQDSPRPGEDIPNRIILSCAATFIFAAIMGAFYAFCANRVFVSLYKYGGNDTSKSSKDWYDEWLVNSWTLIPYGFGEYHYLAHAAFRRARRDELEAINRLRRSSGSHRRLPTIKSLLLAGFQVQRRVMTLMTWQNTLLQLALLLPTSSFLGHNLWAVVYAASIYPVSYFYQAAYVGGLPDLPLEDQ
ncbi:hypothetical protein KEM54_006777 [Ascosphaera aggregata]|nr:hypothetical protein KEM54_006777 [Ascosphaera aggregata]